jgi:phosphoribosylanthranilate isomerase
MADIRVKICGIRVTADLNAVVAAGAHYMGLNFFARSPRFVTNDQARAIAIAAPEGLCKVALVVDADDDFLDGVTATVPLDMLQLHGHETPARVAQIKARYGLPVMKVIGVAGPSDLDLVFEHSLVADQILIDAKAPKDAALPGGNGLTFDWRLVAQRRWLKPWMLAGGLTQANVAEAILRTNARQVDVASGVESAPGMKSPDLIAAFTRAALGAGMVPAIPRLR